MASKTLGLSKDRLSQILFAALIGVVLWAFLDLKGAVTKNTEAISQARVDMVAGFGEVNANLAVLIDRTGPIP